MNEHTVTDVTNLFLAGDSTVASCPKYEAPMAGWGQLFQSFFTEKVKVHNFAKGGASTNTFMEQGYLDTILHFIKPNDYLFIQFGHNDQKSFGTEPFTTYQSNLAQYVEGAREKGAIPVLVTSVHRRTFDEQGKIVNSLGDFPEAMIGLAEKLDVQLINLWEKTKTLYEELGPEGSKQLFTMFEPNQNPNYPDGIQDNTHFCEHGAKAVGSLVIEGIKELKLPIRSFIKE
ncbi:rhamnogalacturonan acetylesterase [Bacillus sinesaloumensis]|uniref:rhamnogalacturonan acetylesterase n=1 Tax=Litchfieldia sinesaloumensis TaxID=1926280 RepID=UPI001F379568|nr:rhamnogalacturonan acetylesterase [Bacillus sinesaloumensis]